MDGEDDNFPIDQFKIAEKLGFTRKVYIKIVNRFNKGDCVDYYLGSRGLIVNNDYYHLPDDSSFGKTIFLSKLVSLKEGDSKFLKCLLKHAKANPDMKYNDGRPLLHREVSAENIYSVKLLLKYGANVNYRYLHTHAPFCTPLEGAVNCHNLEIVKILCDAGASLVCTERPGNIFDKYYHKKYIETLITYARFDKKIIWNKTIPQRNKKQERRTIKVALLVFKRLCPELSPDVKFLIFEKLSPNYLCLRVIFEKLPKNIKQKYLFEQVQKRVEGIQHMLKNYYQDDFVLLKKIKQWCSINKDYTCQQLSKDLLNGSKLKNDYSEFKDAFPDKLDLLLKDDNKDDNLAYEMYKNCSRLAKEQ